MPNQSDLISPDLLTLIITATAIGTLSRLLTIKLDYRQYPNYPNGYLIHAVTGGLAAGLGAIIVPAVVAKEFAAVTFLALGIQHFRDVRQIERESLLDLEGDEYTRRGEAYIDGIAKIFESRNYIALLVALATGLTIQLLQSLTVSPLWLEAGVGSLAGLSIFYLLKNFTQRQQVSDIAAVSDGKIEIRGSSLYVNGLFVSHLMGREEARKWFLEEGLAACIEPTHPHFQIPLLNLGQRQAILFEVTRRLGQRKIYSVQDINSGKLIIALVPVIKNPELLKETIGRTPLLETVKKNPELLTAKKGV